VQKAAAFEAGLSGSHATCVGRVWRWITDRTCHSAINAIRFPYVREISRSRTIWAANPSPLKARAAIAAKGRPPNAMDAENDRRRLTR